MGEDCGTQPTASSFREPGPGSHPSSSPVVGLGDSPPPSRSPQPFLPRDRGWAPHSRPAMRRGYQEPCRGCGSEASLGVDANPGRVWGTLEGLEQGWSFRAWEELVPLKARRAGVWPGPACGHSCCTLHLSTSQIRPVPSPPGVKASPAPTQWPLSAELSHSLITALSSPGCALPVDPSLGIPPWGPLPPVLPPPSTKQFVRYTPGQ